MDTIPLREAIRALRSEILKAVEESVQEVRFELGPIEMEFQVVIRKELDGEAKLGLHVFAVQAEVGGGGKRSDETMQKVKFVLNPISEKRGVQSKVVIARDSPP
jgi:hypothetical protein